MLSRRSCRKRRNEEETIHTYGVVSVSKHRHLRQALATRGAKATVAAGEGPIVAHNYATGTNINANGTLQRHLWSPDSWP